MPADKVLVVSWYKVLFPAAISVSPDLAVLDGSKTLAGTPPKHPCPRKVTGGAPRQPPRRFLLAAKKGGYNLLVGQWRTAATEVDDPYFGRG